MYGYHSLDPAGESGKVGIVFFVCFSYRYTIVLLILFELNFAHSSLVSSPNYESCF